MSIRSRPIAAGLLVASIIGWIVLISVDYTRAGHTPPPGPSIVHGAWIGVLCTSAVLSGGWFGIIFLRNHIDRRVTPVVELWGHIDARFDALTNQQVETSVRADETTQKLMCAAVAPTFRGTVYVSAAVIPPATTSRRRRRHRSGGPPSAPGPNQEQPKGETMDADWRAYLAGVADQGYTSDREEDSGAFGTLGPGGGPVG